MPEGSPASSPGSRSSRSASTESPSMGPRPDTAPRRKPSIGMESAPSSPVRARRYGASSTSSVSNRGGSESRTVNPPRTRLSPLRTSPSRTSTARSSPTDRSVRSMEPPPDRGTGRGSHRRSSKVRGSVRRSNRYWRGSDPVSHPSPETLEPSVVRRSIPTSTVSRNTAERSTSRSASGWVTTRATPRPPSTWMVSGSSGSVIRSRGKRALRESTSMARRRPPSSSLTVCQTGASPGAGGSIGSRTASRPSRSRRSWSATWGPSPSPASAGSSPGSSSAKIRSKFQLPVVSWSRWISPLSTETSRNTYRPRRNPSGL